MVLTGSGNFFSNGFSLDYLKSSGDEGLYEMHKILWRLQSFGKPVVAALNGHAMAGGAMLAVACDFRVMRNDKGFLCVNELDLGMPFTPQMCAMFERKVPIAARAQFVLGAHRYTPQEALQAGLVD